MRKFKLPKSLFSRLKDRQKPLPVIALQELAAQMRSKNRPPNQQLGHEAGLGNA